MSSKYWLRDQESFSSSYHVVFYWAWRPNVWHPYNGIFNQIALTCFVISRIHKDLSAKVEHYGSDNTNTHTRAILLYIARVREDTDPHRQSYTVRVSDLLSACHSCISSYHKRHIDNSINLVLHCSTYVALLFITWNVICSCRILRLAVWFLIL